MKRLLILSVLFFGLVQRSFSQSEFISRGQSGSTGGIGLSTDREKNALNFFAGYSYHGFIDANLTYAKANSGRIQGGVFTPGVTFYLAKQEDAENIPTLGISIGFSRYVSKTTETVIIPDTVIVTWRSYERVIELTVHSLKLGVTAQSRIGSWNVFFFQPLFGADLLVTNSGSEFRLRGGISIGSRVVHGPLLIFTPAIERQSELTTFVLTVGAVF